MGPVDLLRTFVWSRSLDSDSEFGKIISKFNCDYSKFTYRVTDRT